MSSLTGLDIGITRIATSRDGCSQAMCNISTMWLVARRVRGLDAALDKLSHVQHGRDWKPPAETDHTSAR